MRSSKPRQMYTTTTKYSTNPPCRSHAFGASPFSALLLLLSNVLDTLSKSRCTPPPNPKDTPSTALSDAAPVAPPAAATHARTPPSSNAALFHDLPLPCRSFTIRLCFWLPAPSFTPSTNSRFFSHFHMKFCLSRKFILHFTLHDIFVLEHFTCLSPLLLFSLLSSSSCCPEPFPCCFFLVFSFSPI